MRFPAIFVTLLVSNSALASTVDDQAAIMIARPQKLIVAKNIGKKEIETILKPINSFYGFWNNGSVFLLKHALAPKFIDHTLPPGRPQGPAGPATASKMFLNAVPDLKVEVTQRIVVADRVVSHLHFTGHFTGKFMTAIGKNQPVDFTAVDILRVQNGEITDNWHLEDNLTFQQQIGLVPKL